MLRWEVRHRPTPRRRLQSASLPIVPSRPTRPEAPPLEGSPLAILLAVLGAVVIGAALWLAGAHSAADIAWAAAVTLALIPLGISVARDLLHRETGVDLIALLAMAGLAHAWAIPCRRGGWVDAVGWASA